MLRSISAFFRVHHSQVDEAQARKDLALQKQGVEGICMDVVPDNIPALRLYHRLGYDRLSIVTVRKHWNMGKTFSDVV